jgi:hypothetical protein
VSTVELDDMQEEYSRCKLEAEVEHCKD